MPGSVYDKPFPITDFAENPLSLAAAVFSVCAYPEVKQLRRGGKAEDFFEAQRAWLIRRGRGMGIVRKLPNDLPPRQQQTNGLKQGLERLDRANAAYQLLIELAHEVQRAESGGSWLTMKSSGDFSRMTMSFYFDQNGKPLATNIGGAKPSVERAITRHAEAFGQYVQTEDTVRDIRRRTFYRFLGSMHIFAAIYSECLAFAQSATERKWPIYLVALSNPDWTKRIVERSNGLAYPIASLIRSVGVRWFDRQNQLLLS